MSQRDGNVRMRGLCFPSLMRRSTVAPCYFWPHKWTAFRRNSTRFKNKWIIIKKKKSCQITLYCSSKASHADVWKRSEPDSMDSPLLNLSGRTIRSSGRFGFLHVAGLCLFICLFCKWPRHSLEKDFAQSSSAGAPPLLPRQARFRPHTRLR